MAIKRYHQTLGDYVTMALSPALIMALVGSLVFFLVEVFNAGDRFQGRARWTLSWFVFGAVLVARMTIHPAIGPRARAYGMALGAAVFFALQRFLSLQQFAGNSSAVQGFDWAFSLGLIVL